MGDITKYYLDGDDENGDDAHSASSFPVLPRVFPTRPLAQALAAILGI